MTIDFTPSRDLFPFESKWFESSVGRVHYIDEGEGRPIVFCHGQPMWSFLYRHIVIGLRERFRCVVIDYPGYGLSVRPDGYGYTPKEHARVVGELVDYLELDDIDRDGSRLGRADQHEHGRSQICSCVRDRVGKHMVLEERKPNDQTL